MDRKFKLLLTFIAASATIGGVALAAASPSVSTGSATSIQQSSAKLTGKVNPNGSSTSYQFEYGLTSAYGVLTSPKSAGSGTVSKAIASTISGLLPGTVYHYRLLAQNKSGSASGADRTLRTAGNPPPDVATGPVSQVGATSAVVTGVINPHNQATTYYFDYGTSTAYTARTPTAAVAAGSAPITIEQTLAPLPPGTFIHYRLVALHGSVSNTAVDASFLTLPSPRLKPHVTAVTTPRRLRKAPFTLNTFGSITRLSYVPQSLGCAQNAIVRFFFGKREVAATVMPVQPNCTFAGQTVIPHLPGRGNKHRTVTLRVFVRARGNGYLATTDAGSQTVVLGG